MMIGSLIATRQSKSPLVALFLGVLAFINFVWIRGIDPPTAAWNPLIYSRELSEQENKVFHLENFYMHIPKTGGWNVFFEVDRMTKDAFQRRAQRPRSCNIGALPLQDVATREWCKFCFTEQKYSKIPVRTYTMIREPRDHVLSQYFHCTESEEHRKRSQFMPKSLDDWLEAWVEALGNSTKASENSKFFCYDPRNLQSSFVLHGLEENESNGLETLEKRFEVIAPFERMETAICVIFIQFSGRVPDECVCATERKLDIDHGVTHHASSFVTTPKQDYLIGKLIQDDILLHEYTNELFEKKLGSVEKEYGVSIC